MTIFSIIDHCDEAALYFKPARVKCN